MPNPVIGMVGSAVIGGGASLIGGKMQADAANRATDAQVIAQRESIAAQKEMFGEQKKALEPWQQAGLDAMAEIQQGIKDGTWDLSKYGMEDLVQDPGYQFRLEQGQNALDMAGARAGKLLSGDQLIAASDYNQAAASQEFGNAFARAASERDVQYNILQDIMNRGYGAATALSGVQGQFGDKMANAYTNIGNAQAQGAINVGNAWNNALTGLATTGQNAISNFTLYNRLQQLGGI